MFSNSRLNNQVCTVEQGFTQRIGQTGLMLNVRAAKEDRNYLQFFLLSVWDVDGLDRLGTMFGQTNS